MPAFFARKKRHFKSGNVVFGACRLHIY